VGGFLENICILVIATTPEPGWSTMSMSSLPSAGIQKCGLSASSVDARHFPCAQEAQDVPMYFYFVRLYQPPLSSYSMLPASITLIGVVQLIRSPINGCKQGMANQILDCSHHWRRLCTPDFLQSPESPRRPPRGIHVPTRERSYFFFFFFFQKPFRIAVHTVQ
jgi:hypothetical protein